jgi:hypothetical protein
MSKRESWERQESDWYTRGWCESICYESTKTARLRKLPSRGWYDAYPLDSQRPHG